MPDAAVPLPETILRAIVEQASDGIFLTDASLRIEWVNDAACAMLCHSREAMVGKRIGDLVEPEDLARAPLRESELRAGVPTRTLRRFRRPDGAIRLLEVSAKALGDGRLLGLARDVTDRHVLERLEHTEASFRVLIEASPDAVMVHRDWRIVYLNAAGVTIFGLPDAESAIGMHILDVVHPDERERARDRIKGLEKPWAATTLTDMRFLRRDGRSILLSVAGVRVMFEGQPSIVGMARDVSEQRRLQLQLAQSERMASLGTLAAGVGHEINNPLAYVLLNLEGIARLAKQAEPPMAAALSEHVQSATEGARRVAGIVRDLRAFSRVDDDARTVVDVRRPLEIALNTASHELKHRARVTVALDEAAPVNSSEGKLVQVFLNLLINAGHSIPEGRPNDNEVRVAARCDGDKVLVTIADTGAGITEEHRQRLFEPFFTTKDAGSGLGLAICHGLVSAMGGSIHVESMVGRGTTFSVVLPRALLAAPPPSPEPPPPSSARGRILVVDDEPSIGSAIANVLGAQHDVTVLSSAHQARGAIEGGAAYDVIVCDVVMPEMTGADFYRWVRGRDPSLATRMVFITGGREGGAARELANIEPARWLEKPFTIDSLHRAIGAVLSRGHTSGGLERVT